MALMSRGGAERRFDGGDVTTVIGAEAYFQGALTVRGSLRVDGEVEGNILEAQTVVVGATGRVRGDVSAEHVVVAGSINGEVVATAQLELKSGGRLVGNIRTPKLTIDEGAVFDGRCAMAETPAAPERPADAVPS
ncbi:MAG: polymer-forming cytoskeletal protein [Elusimicrobia bacterium]|nr:polymer-forming cytoskeletal protein [Elusimicrobiota bacterium]